MATLGTARRYYLSKRHEANLRNDEPAASVWRAKQEAESGVALASTFPHRATLATLGYTTTEDLTGADEAELVRAGLTASQARDVIAEL